MVSHISGNEPHGQAAIVDNQAVSGLMPGRMVRVRQRHYLIDQVIASTGGTILKLSCADPDNLGRPLEIVWEAELDRQIIQTESWGLIGDKGFDPPDVFSAYYHTIRWNRVTAAREDLFQAPFRAGISIEHYQLEPLRMAMQMPRVNLFIADGVGLGKTIEAGLIARELLLRRKINEIIVCCPPSMMLQWQEEMESKFGLLFQIMDRNFVQKIRRERGFSVNPWSQHSRFIVSHNLLKDEEYTSDLRDWLGKELVRPRSLLILDEAHHAAPATSSSYAITSQFTRRVKELAPKFEHKLFLSATPHNGHSNSFSMLMSILDPQRFTPGLPVRAKERDEVLIYRLKDDLRKLSISFPNRHVSATLITTPVKGTPELELLEILDSYFMLREARLKLLPPKVTNASAFIKSGLQQRLLSSVEAFSITLSKHHATVQKQLQAENAERMARQAQDELDEALLERIGEGVSDEDEPALAPSATISADDSTDARPRTAEEEASDRQTELATLATWGNTDDPRFQQELDLLERMLEQATRHRNQPDQKIKKLCEYIDQNMLAESTSGPRGWASHRLIIFTEYEDTLDYIRRQLEHHIRATDQADARILIYRGRTSLEERHQIKEAFNTAPAVAPVRILLATDAAREGLNLQHYCHNLFHYDIPWNPARLEQRNGRIDRKLQPSADVFCRYFEYENRSEDRVLKRIIEKTDLIYEELGGFGRVVSSRAIKRILKEGISRSKLSEQLLAFDVEKNDLEVDSLVAQAQLEMLGDQTELPDELPDSPSQQEAQSRKALSARDKIDEKRLSRLKQGIEKTRGLLETSKKWLEFREEQFRAAMNCSLKLMDIESGLVPETFERQKARRYFLPTDELAKQQDWRDSINLLRSRRHKNEKYGDWITRCPIRPLVFEDPNGPMEGHDAQAPKLPSLSDPIHLHLEHRIVHRLLGRFQAQGFTHHDISRACLATTSGSTPLVFLIGRHCLYGENASRLHEDMVVVCSEYTFPDRRTGPLTTVSPEKLSEEACFQRLDQALLAAARPRLSNQLHDSLLSSAQQDIQELRPLLEKKAGRLEAEIRKKLAEVAIKESDRTRKLLEELKIRIEKDLEKRARQATGRPSLTTPGTERQAAFFDTSEELTTDEKRLRNEKASEKRLLEERLRQLPAEIENEPKRILKRYTVETPRLEPVGIIYLWPEQG